jgi:hypothetical protein
MASSGIGWSGGLIEKIILPDLYCTIYYWVHILVSEDSLHFCIVVVDVLGYVHFIKKFKIIIYFIMPYFITK